MATVCVSELCIWYCCIPFLHVIPVEVWNIIRLPWTSLDILLAAWMADSGAEIHSSVLAWMKLWSVSVFQLLLIYLESTLHCVNSPTAEGAVLQLIFIPSSSFLFPPFFCVITICCSNKMPKPVIYLFRVLTEKRWALIIDQNSNRCAGIRFFTCMVLLNVGWGGLFLLCIQALCPGCASSRCCWGWAACRDLCWLQSSHVISSASWLGACC